MSLVSKNILQLAITKALHRSFLYRSIEDVTNEDLDGFSEAVVETYIARSEQAKLDELMAAIGKPAVEEAEDAEVFPVWMIEQWTGCGIDNLDTGKTYNVTGTHLKQILQAYRELASRCGEAAPSKAQDAEP